MAISAEHIAYLEDLFSVVDGASIRKMFGGVGIFRNGLMFALSLADGRIALKADDETIPQFEAEGCEQWVYERKDKKSVSMGYWTMPERLADDTEDFREWAEKAYSAAVRHRPSQAAITAQTQIVGLTPSAEMLAYARRHQKHVHHLNA